MAFKICRLVFEFSFSNIVYYQSKYFLSFSVSNVIYSNETWLPIQIWQYLQSHGVECGILKLHTIFSLFFTVLEFQNFSNTDSLAYSNVIERRFKKTKET